MAPTSLKLLTFVYFLMRGLAIINCQNCEVGLIFPLETSSRVIRLAKITTDVMVNVRHNCTNVNTMLTFTDPDVALVSSAIVMITISGNTSVEHTVNLNTMVTTNPESFTITLSSLTVNVAVETGFDVLSFTRENVAEVSFDTSQVFQSPVGGSANISIERSEPMDTEQTLMIDERLANDMRRRFSNLPILVTFPANRAKVYLEIVIAYDDPLVQTLAIVRFVDSSLSSGLLSTRNAQTETATVYIVSPPVLSTKISSISLSSSSTSVSFGVVTSRPFNTDIVITLTYSGDFVVASNRESSLTLLSGEDEVDLIFPISSTVTGTQTFTVEIGVGSGDVINAFVDENMKTTTYVIESPIVFISILERSFTAEEGDFIIVRLLTNIPAPFAIAIDVYTPVSADAVKIENLGRAVIATENSGVDIALGVVEDGISEQTQTVTIVFQSLTPRAIVDRIADSVTITILANSGSSGDINPPILNPPDVNTNPGDGSGTSNSAVVGIIVAVVLVFLVVTMLFCCCVVVMCIGGGCGRGSLF